MDYLPIGTVISLEDGSQPLMIYGRKQINTNGNTKWDYVACLYPEGNIGDEYNVFFNAEILQKYFLPDIRQKLNGRCKSF